MGLEVVGFGGSCYGSNCSRGPVWVYIVVGVVALGISALTHQGYRSRRGRWSIFGSLFGSNDDYSLRSYQEDHELRLANEQFKEAQLLKGVRNDYGAVPGGAPPMMNQSVGATPPMKQDFGAAPAGTSYTAQTHAMSDPGGMVDATGMDRATVANAGAAAAAAAAATSSSAPPGWYADPELPRAMRYWSGDTWSPSGTTPPGVSAPPPA